MFNLIPASLLVMALGGIIYIISSHLSEFDEEKNDDPIFNLKAYFVNYINQLPLDNFKIQSISLTQKILHRFRLILLKTDNHLMKVIGKISEKDRQINGSSRSSYGEAGNGSENNNGSDFWENLSKSKQDDRVIEPVIKDEIKIEFAVDKNKKIEKFFDIKPAKKTSKTKKSLK